MRLLQILLFPFLPQIPSSSFITNLSITINDKTFWGVINRISVAQGIYQNATQQGKSAILLSQIGADTYRLDFNIARLSTVIVSVYYFQRLVRSSGLYDVDINYPDLLLLPLSWNSSISIESPNRQITKIVAPAEYSQVNISSNKYYLEQTGNANNYPGLNKDVISYMLSGSNYGSNIYTYSNGTDEYFFTTLTPVLEQANQQIGKDFVFVLDVSGSMGGTKITQAKSAILEILNNLYIDDRVGIVKFSDSATAAKSVLVNKSDTNGIDTLKGWVSALNAGGGTNILDGLKTGANLFDSSSRPKILVVLTDGNPTSGVTNTVDIESQFTNYNKEIDASLYALGFGSDVDFNFLQRIARENNGDGLQIPVSDNSLESLSSFYSMISTPLIVNMSVSINSGVVGQLYPYFLPNIYAGSELFLVGKRSGNISIEITGQTADQTGHWQIIDTNPSSTNKADSWVADLWAITTIKDLLTQISYTTDNKTPLIEKVVAIALDFGLVTPYTGITVVVPDYDTLLNEISTTTVEGYLPGMAPQTTYATITLGRTVVNSTATKASPGFEIVVGLLALSSGIVLRKRKNMKH